MAALKASGGAARRKEVQIWAEANLSFTEWEQEEIGESPVHRWWKFMNYVTTDAVRADLLIKDNGLWTLTEGGVQLYSELGAHELYQLATDRYREWYAENRAREDESDDNDDDDSDESTRGASSQNLKWTRRHIFHAGLLLLAQSPGKRLEGKQVVQKLPGAIPEDAQEALEKHDSDWPNKYGVTSLYLAVRVGWLQRKSGIWSLTPSGAHALEHYSTATDLWLAARTLIGKEEGEVAPPPYLGAVSPAGQLPPTLYSTHNSTVQHLVSEIDAGTLALPDIQRPFVWKNAKVRDLLDSMFRGFPFGFILTWRSPSEVRTKAIGIQKKGMRVPHALVIDGQQRLTSLFAVMTGKSVLDDQFRERKIQIAFHPISGAFKVADAAIRKNPEWIPDVSAIYADSMGALSVVRAYLKKLELARELEDSHIEAAEQNIERLVGLKNTPLGVLEISSKADEEQVAEIFVRINSQGQNLKQADFILTLLAVFWEEGREQLENFARACKLPSADSTAHPFNRLMQPGPDDLIRVVVAVSHRRARLSAAYQVLRGKDPVSGQITTEARDANLEKLSNAQKEVLDPGNWHEFLKTLQAAGFHNPSMISSMNAALMAYSLWLIGRRSYGLSVTQLRELIGRWFAFVIVTGRYSGSPESIMEEDLAQLRPLKDGDGTGFTKTLQAIISGELTSDFWTHTLPARLESSNVRTLNSFFAAQCRLNAKSLFSEPPVATLLDPQVIARRKALEVHHLFPKAWLKSQGITNSRDYNQVANQTLVEWSVNNEIADQDPAVYGPVYSPKSTAATLALHAMPECWWKMEYADFLVERRRLMADVIRRGMGQPSFD